MLTEKIKDTLINILFGVGCLFLLYTLFIWFPVSLKNQANCLENGYPSAVVTVGLEAYCITQEGVTQPKVVKLNAD